MRARLALLTAGLALATPATAPALELQQVATVTAPTAIAAPPGDPSRLVVAQRNGLLRLVVDGALREQPFLDLRAGIKAGGEQGLLGVAFSPDYATDGLLYTFRTVGDGGTLTVEEHRRGATPDSAVAGDVVLGIPHDGTTNHNGGQLAFGPDGMLYVGTGDGGGGGDPAGNAQNLTDASNAQVGGANRNALLGKVLRIDPRAVDPGYVVPGGNPFAAPAAEVWALGLRNPFRFSFDRATGALVVADVGQDAIEEVSVLPAPPAGAGANLGWDRFEGRSVFDAGVALATPAATEPVLEHRHDATPSWCSITGGHVWRDTTSPELAGQYVYGDFCHGQVWAAGLGADGGRPLGLPRVGSISTFGEDALGRLHVANLSTGAVFRLAGAPAPGATPPPGAPGGPAAAAPRLTLSAAARQRVLRTGRVSLVVACDVACRAGVSARPGVVRAGRTRYVRGATTTRTLAAGARVRVAVKLPAASRRSLARALRAGRRATVRVSVTASAGGRTTLRRATVRVVRR